MGLDPGISEVIGGTSECDDQVVVGQIADGGIDGFMIGVYPQDVSDADIYIFRVLKYFSQGKRDAGGFQPGGGDLVHQRLELVIVMFVDEKDFIIRPVEIAGEAQAGKAGANDNDPLPVVIPCCHTFNFYRPTELQK